MSIRIKNIATGEVATDKSLRILNGKIVGLYVFAEPSEKWCNAHPYVIRQDETIFDEKHNVECRVFKLAEGFELETTRKPRERRTQPSEAPQPQPQPEPVPSTDTVEDAEIVTEEAPQPTPQPQPEPIVVQTETNGLTDALGAAFAPVFANVAKEIERNVRANVQAEIDALKATALSQTTRIELVTPSGETHEVDGIFCEKFDVLCRMVNAGWSPYLWGAAGCGKSHTCEQIAEALGLDYYAQNMLNFAHEIAGYGNAGGEFVPTPFYQAFAYGGLFHLDEADRSAIEGLVTLNQALANGVFNFPVIGNVKAHPNFRFICSGNTQMNGADEMYTSGQQQDASFKRRVVFFEMHYDRRIELPIMAQGDEVLVDFVEDVRRAIKKTGTLHFVSYTETKFMKEFEDMKEFALVASTFKSLDIDIIRQIYGALDDKENPWSVALYKVIKDAK